MLVLPRDWQAKLHTHTHLHNGYATVQAAKAVTLAAVANAKEEGTNCQPLNIDADVVKRLGGCLLSLCAHFKVAAAEEDTIFLGCAHAGGRGPSCASQCFAVSMQLLPTG